MKLGTIIITTCGVLAVAVPAAQAAPTNSRIYQTKIHTVLAEKHTQATAASQARLSEERYYQAENRFYAKQIQAARRQALVDKDKRLDGDPGWKN
jgi:hypothetical protein